MFEDFMKTPMLLMSRKETKDEWGNYEYEEGVDILGKLQKSDTWTISATMTEMVRKARVYLMPEITVFSGDKLLADGDEYVVDDVNIVRDKEGVVHHLELDL